MVFLLELRNDVDLVVVLDLIELVDVAGYHHVLLYVVHLVQGGALRLLLFLVIEVEFLNCLLVKFLVQSRVRDRLNHWLYRYCCQIVQGC